MSAIWGMVDFMGGELSDQVCHKMDKYYETKKIDAIQAICKDNFYLACGLQWIHKESKLEKYPYVENDSGYMVADAIVDNRDELKEKYQLSQFSKESMADGSIMFDCINQNFEKALQDMLGAYCFAYYKKDENRLYLVSDAVGNRSIYYRYVNGKVSFSTLLDPLIVKKKDGINEDWFFHFFVQDSLRIMAEARETPYAGVYRVEPGEVVSFDKNGMRREYYYNPLKTVKPLLLDSDEAYKEQVIQVMKAAVEGTLREETQTAILLSGGLDSNAVAAFALPKLKERGEKLYSFTSIPGKELASNQLGNTYYVDDESLYINEIKKMHDNLEADYIDASDVDLLSVSHKIVEILEYPYKALANMHWIYTAYQRAYDKGCRTILSGQYGNVTISFGDFEILFVSLLHQGKIGELTKQIKRYSKRYRKSRKWIYTHLLQSCVGQNSEAYRSEYLSAEKQRKYCQEIGEKENQKQWFELDFENYKHYLYDRVALRQVGESEVKLSLETGVIPRDPTRDKRLIELALSLPLTQYVKDGYARRLARKYLKGYIPDLIAEDEYHRGRQGSGSYVTMRSNWYGISQWIREVYKEQSAKEWIVVEDWLKILANNPEEVQNLSREQDSVRNRAMYMALACEFMEQI